MDVAVRRGHRKAAVALVHLARQRVKNGVFEVQAVKPIPQVCFCLFL